MNISIKATNLELTDALRDYATKRVTSLAKYIHGNPETKASIEIGKTTNHHHSGEIFSAEVNLHVGGKMFRAVVEKDDLYAAIDEVRESLFREITGNAGKTRTLFKRGGQIVKDTLRGIGGFFRRKK